MTKKTSTSIDQEFQKFWDTYGLKRDRVAAERAWRKLTKSDRRAALDGIQRYREDCEARGIQRMYAQGYLNHRRWEDEQEDPTAAKGKYSPPSQGGDGGGSLPDMAIW